MLIVISPAKALDFETPARIAEFTIPEMLDNSEKLIEVLKQKSPPELQKLMNISPNLGELNFRRFREWGRPFTVENAKQAILAFTGEVFRGIKAAELPENELKYAQNKLRILSGLYGVLKPLDIIMPYRLEMGTKLKTADFNNLYDFWGTSITVKINEAVAKSGSRIVVNLASNEYFKSIDKKLLDAEVVTPEFKDLKNGKYKMITVYAKRARGLMTRFIIENKIDDAESLQAFDIAGYNYNPRLSKAGNPVFTREH